MNGRQIGRQTDKPLKGIGLGALVTSGVGLVLFVKRPGRGCVPVDDGDRSCAHQEHYEWIGTTELM